MQARTLVAALATAGVVGTGAAAFFGNVPATVASAYANPVAAAGVAAPAAHPAATALPLDGFSSLVKQVGPAVVNVSVDGVRNVSDSAQDEGEAVPGSRQLPPELREFFRGFGGRGQPFPGFPRGDIPMRGQGSGFIVSGDGYILTNAHVVDRAQHVNVRLTDRREYRAKVVGIDRATDVAVLKIDAKNLPTVRLGKSSGASVGEWVVAIGSPFGFENSVTAGIVSAKGRSLPDSSYVNFIQTDVAVNPGNSGGPLFNLAGEVIGINSQIYSRSGGFQGISFAIPIETALDVRDQIVKHGKVTRGRIAVTIQDVNAGLAESFGLDRPRGALVSSVEPDGPGAKAGLQPGDIILSYDGRPVERSNELPPMVAAAAPGKNATIEIWRDKGRKTLTIAPTEGNARERLAGNDAPAAKGRLGVTVRPLSPEERREGGPREGVVVEQAGGAAARAGLQPGDVIVSLNGATVKSPEELRERVEKAGRTAAVLVERQGQRIFVPVELG